MINYIKGDIFSTDCDIICHGVNCSGGFGSGIAGQIAKKYPMVREAYLEKFKTEGWKLGDVQWIKPDQDWKRIFANCATQQYYKGFPGIDPKLSRFVDYSAIVDCMTQVNTFAKATNKTIAMPKIGAGLGGGNWDEIICYLNDIFIAPDAPNVIIYSLE